ncbi:MAG: Rpn family recombination-promoting nuclease/putative transposase [Methanobrevibacter sp.]|nr:Rpn family recombination-promoting nuclease/putative transposase [Candidatus Methanovirga australis]
MYKLTSKNKNNRNKDIGNRNIKLMDDQIFKLIFGRNESKEILESFSERILERKIRIKDILNGEAVADVEKGKEISLDIVAKTIDNTIIHIEAQNAYDRYLENRIKHYADRECVVHLKKGDSYRDAQKVISIAILNHKFYKEKPKIYKHEYQILNTKDYSVYDDKLLEIVIFDRLKKEYYDFNNSIDLIFMYLFDLLSPDELEKAIKEDELIKNIERRKNMISKTEEEEFLKLELEKREMMEKYRIEDAAKEALEKGRIEGIEKGKEEGIEEGRIESLIQTALRLKDKGFSLEDISDITGLSFEKLKNLTS